MRMFRAHHVGAPRIEPVEVVDELKYHVRVGDLWFPRHSPETSFWPTFAEAKEHLVTLHDKGIAEAGIALSNAHANYNIAVQLNEPT